MRHPCVSIVTVNAGSWRDAPEFRGRFLTADSYPDQHVFQPSRNLPDRVR